MLKVEICCGSADDVVRAGKAGAHRVELNSDLFAGGLTPSVGSLIEAKKYSSLPIICMLRPRAGGFCYSEHEFQTIMNDLQALKAAGANGFAVGFLNKDGELDISRLKAVVEAAGNCEMVFHRAFDCMKADPFQTANQLADLGFTRILTSGRKSTAWEGRELIRDLHAMNRIEILPGSGLRRIDLSEFLKATGCDQIHLTFHKLEVDPSIQNPEISFSGNTPADDYVSIVDKEGLMRFIRNLPV